MFCETSFCVVILVLDYNPVVKPRTRNLGPEIEMPNDYCVQHKTCSPQAEFAVSYYLSNNPIQEIIH
ncbi:MAG: hypothetical protein COT43_07095 [Candidatus Marinimicrobia bacterium CG08_land_8_20_14_0_20_45_22]|nr:MAG: hypothetical protein COT43_07095 [Candidatus Marinimicrobia bacterium CG08_land_8_20_14_0_20_45_22]